MTLATLLPLLVPACIAGGLWHYACSRFDRNTALVLLLALGLYYFHFAHSNWTQFTEDAEPHMENAQFILAHNRLPTHNDHLAAARHPPGFYILTAELIGLGRVAGVSDPEQFSRNIAMLCSAVFIVMGTHLLRLLLGNTGPAYFAALGMLAFWPVQVTMGGRITCDVLLFAGQAGALFALTRWLREPGTNQLAAPFWWGGIATLGKNSGVLMSWLAVFALCFTAYQHRRNLRAVFKINTLASMAFALGCYVLTYRHGSIFIHLENYPYLHWDLVFAKASHFNLFLLAYDADLGLSQDSFWNMWLHTLLLGGASMRWSSPDIIILLKVLWLAIIAYSVHGVFAARKALNALEKRFLALLCGFIGVMIAAQLYLLLRTANPNFCDARYSYVSMLLFPTLLGVAMRHHALAGRNSLLRVGMLLGAVFTGGTVALIAAQHL